MTLLDRYLGAVAALLPRAQREDIVAELRDILLNQIEAEEGRLGRPLDRLETEVLLRRFGHPLAVAGRYGPQRALIGVELYPFYIFAVKVALAIAAFVTVILTAAQVAAVGHDPVGTLTGAFHTFLPTLLIRMTSDFIPTALMLIGLATVVGAAIERGWIKTDAFQQWRVADLPQLSDLSGRKGPFQSKQFEALMEVVATMLFILWWLGVVRLPGLDGGHEGLQVTWAPIIDTLRLPILLLAVGQVLSGLIVVLRPSWVRPRAAAEIVLSIAGLALVAVLWQARPFVSFGGPAIAAEDLANLRMTVDSACLIGLAAAAAIMGGKLVVDGWRLACGPRV